jgi:hypothetical protein
MSETPEVLANMGNAAIVAMPGRQFPGCWVAADTMFSWFQSLADDNADDFQSEVEDVSDQMRTLLTAYVRQRRENGKPIPFEWPDVDQHFGLDENDT